MSGGSGKPRCTPPSPPVPMNPMPDRAACRERAADSRRADDALNERRRKVARADLARGGREACQLIRRSPTRSTPSSTPTWREPRPPLERAARSRDRPRCLLPAGSRGRRGRFECDHGRRSASAWSTSSETLNSSFTASSLVSRRTSPRPRAPAPARRRGSRRQAHRRRPSYRGPRRGGPEAPCREAAPRDPA